MAIGARLRGILDELIATGYPQQVAERIASGDLPMDTASRMNRRREMGLTKKVYHTGAPNISEFDPYAGQFERSDTGIFVIDDPIASQTYMGTGKQTYPLYIRDREMPYLDAGGLNFNELHGVEVLGPDDSVLDIAGGTTNEIARQVLEAGLPGVEFRDMIDRGPNIRDAKRANPKRAAELDRMDRDFDIEKPTVYSVADPTLIRSQFAAFDPEYKGSNILGERAIPVAGAGLLAAAAMSPEEVEAGPLSAAARAAQQGFTNKQYHASMQDFDRIVPGYDDGLFFTTPNPEFASDWAGKGRLQNREGELDSYDRYRPQKEKLYEEMGSPEFGTPEYDEFVNRSSEIYRQEQNAFKTVYPLLARTEKTFDPEKNFDDIADLFDEGRLNAPFSAEYPTFADALKGGNYILYENPEVVGHLKSKGYDSMFLRESTGSKEAREAPYTTVAHFYPDRNIRSQFAEFAEGYTGPNILGGTAAGALGLTALMAPEEAEAGPVKTAKDLLFLHNTTADKLARQSAMGGMPNPSIAVTQQDVPFTGFGDISLVGKPEAFDPKLRSNPLYSADAYTVRAPSPVRIANKGAYKQFSSDFAPYRDAGNIDDVAYSLADLETKTRLEPSDFRRVNDFLEYDNAAALKFADDVGIKLSNKDYHEISQMKRDNADKYREWKDGILDKYFQREEFFVTNPDFDRYAGRANLKPYTADNVSRYMTRQAGANKESTMTFGAGNIRASTAERIPSLPKAREMKGLLQPADAVAEVKETASMMLGDLQTALRDYYKYDASSFRYFDEVGEMIALSERKGMKRAMEEVGFENVPDSLVKEIEEYKDYLRSAPTEYFESKPQRAVQLTDFAGAIVPENTSQGVLDMLSRAGLKVEKYGDEASRTEARKRFQDYMFDAAPTIGGGVGLGLLGMPQESVADTAERLRAENDTSGAYAPRSETLQDVTMALRGLERRLEGNPASLLFPSGYVQHLEEFNRPYERSTFTGALLGALDFL